MDKKLYTKIVKFIEPSIEQFHETRITKLRGLKLNTILRKKNPYLFKAKNILTSYEIVKSILDAYLSSQEEGIFGNFLEALAIFICKEIYGGRKSSTEGIDLEFERENIRYIISIKSGPNWGNSQQLRRMLQNFAQAKRILGAENVIAVNGCCYGKDPNPNKGTHFKLCGQDFWELISGDKELYKEIIEPIGYKAKEKNEKFNKEYAKVINIFTKEFTEIYCNHNGEILWEELIKFNSGSKNFQ